jgi:hypothetical protein
MLNGAWYTMNLKRGMLAEPLVAHAFCGHAATAQPLSSSCMGPGSAGLLKRAARYVHYALLLQEAVIVMGNRKSPSLHTFAALSSTRIASANSVQHTAHTLGAYATACHVYPNYLQQMLDSQWM